VRGGDLSGYVQDTVQTMLVLMEQFQSIQRNLENSSRRMEQVESIEQQLHEQQ